jgi:hypothetical protein
VSAPGVMGSPEPLPVTLVVPEPGGLPLGAVALTSLGVLRIRAGARRRERRSLPPRAGSPARRT